MFARTGITRTHIARTVAAIALAVSLGGCSTISAAWNDLWDGDGDSAATVAPATVAPAEPAASAAPNSQVCDTLRTNASSTAAADATSRQLAIDEMKRIGCADIPAS
jgi:hypothetical protein